VGHNDDQTVAPKDTQSGQRQASDKDIRRGPLVALCRRMMNSKNKGKKLSLNREALRLLNRSEAGQVHGGEQSADAPFGGGITKVHETGMSKDAAKCTERVAG
jgi:hypothetical protein